ncbi:Class I alpha-mannosidase [Penicillium angulare]|uniref:Class I alpha-mannosidase n=1 Tax=Penicillium angulare TaxID=116970 RepID=UPI00253FB211|nr:Class I alpha-mannosidase [Penicillium angulare]KAJ5272749.1 Class I alpha-mannosidase [Penicillium angulare]
MPSNRRGRPLTTAFFLLIAAYIFLFQLPFIHFPWSHLRRPTPVINHDARKDNIHLTDAHQIYPIKSTIQLPTSPSPLPRIQHEFEPESRFERKERLRRQKVVKQEFLHAWNGYKDHAWLRDEVNPVSGKFEDSFSGWGATLVDSLDTLIIMGLDDEVELALEALEQIDFTTTFSSEVNVFEIIIRYMGGLIGAHDLTNGKYPILLQKAQELGDMIYHAFDTHNHMPQMRWKWSRSAIGQSIEPMRNTNLAELGSLTLEFTRLTQLTNNPKYYDAVQRITNELDKNQMKTNVPGLWPVSIDAMRLDFTGTEFSIGGCADSTYEYLPKEHIILGAQTDQYEKMYIRALDAIKHNLLFRAVTKDEDKKILFTGDLKLDRRHGPIVQHSSDHLKCFLGGTVGLAAKIFNRPQDLTIARGLTDGCIWAYDSMPTGIMPESFQYTPCKDMDECPWDEKRWYESVLRQPLKQKKDLQEAQQIIASEGVPPGMGTARNTAYKLRPEALESVFYMYRITGDKSLQDAAWRMFQNIEKSTRTKYGHSSIEDVRDPISNMEDKMESYWLAETLKYLYLIFSEPGVVSLDEYVLSTEAHPFKRSSGFV